LVKPGCIVCSISIYMLFLWLNQGVSFVLVVFTCFFG